MGRILNIFTVFATGVVEQVLLQIITESEEHAALENNNNTMRNHRNSTRRAKQSYCSVGSSVLAIGASNTLEVRSRGECSKSNEGDGKFEDHG